jgi:hypothetical protein
MTASAIDKDAHQPAHARPSRIICHYLDKSEPNKRMITLGNSGAEPEITAEPASCLKWG